MAHAQSTTSCFPSLGAKGLRSEVISVKRTEGKKKKRKERAVGMNLRVIECKRERGKEEDGEERIGAQQNIERKKKKREPEGKWNIGKKGKKTMKMKDTTKQEQRKEGSRHKGTTNTEKYQKIRNCA